MSGRTSRRVPLAGLSASAIPRTLSGTVGVTEVLSSQGTDVRTQLPPTTLDNLAAWPDVTYARYDDRTLEMDMQ